MPGPWRDLIVNLCVSDQETNGQPLLPPAEGDRVRDYLSRLLVDFRALTAHVQLLQEFYQATFHAPLPRLGWINGQQPLDHATPARGFRHNQLLPEDKAQAIAKRGVGSDVLSNQDLAVLLLNPAALWDVHDLIEATWPQTWVQRMDEVGWDLMTEMEELGLDLSIPGVPIPLSTPSKRNLEA